MKLSHAKLLALLLLVAATASGCGVINRIRAKNALNEGVRAYKEGKFDDAQQRGEEVLALHPPEPGAEPDNTQKNAQLLVAYSLQQQYKPGVEAPENEEKARQAIEAYKRVLANNPNDEIAYNQIAVLFRQLKEEENEHNWLVQRANLETAPKEKRADAFIVLASKQWKCAYDITEASKQVNTTTGVVNYKKPENQADFDKAQSCIAEGMELTEKAINLNPNSPDAWTYKTNLLREKAKLAQMEGKDQDKKSFDEEADKAEATQRKLTEEAAAKKAAEEEAKKTPTPPAS